MVANSFKCSTMYHSSNYRVSHIVNARWQRILALNIGSTVLISMYLVFVGCIFCFVYILQVFMQLQSHMEWLHSSAHTRLHALLRVHNVLYIYKMQLLHIFAWLMQQIAWLCLDYHFQVPSKLFQLLLLLHRCWCCCCGYHLLLPCTRNMCE